MRLVKPLQKGSITRGQLSFAQSRCPNPVEGEISWDPPSPGPTEVIPHQTDIGTSQGPQNCCSSIKSGPQTVASRSPLCGIQEIHLQLLLTSGSKGSTASDSMTPQITARHTQHFYSLLLQFRQLHYLSRLLIHVPFPGTTLLQWIERSLPLPSALPQLLSHFLWCLVTPLFV